MRVEETVGNAEHGSNDWESKGGGSAALEGRTGSRMSTGTRGVAATRVIAGPF